jgi:hypothetical protein
MERKFKKTLGTLWLRNKDLTWLGDTIDKAVQSRSRGDFFKHRRDGYKALHVIRCSNQHGNFLEVSEFHRGSHQSVIRIPEGVECQGWVNFLKMCRGFWATTHAAAGVDQYGGVHENRKGVASEPKIRWASKGKEPIITPNFENRVNVGVKSDMGVKIKDTNGNKSRHSNTAHPTVNARVGLKIQLELVYGPGGKWDVAWAHVTDTEAHSQAQDRPPPRQVWKPKLNNPMNRVPSQPRPSTTPESPLDSSKAPKTSQNNVEMPLTSSLVIAAPSQAMPEELSVTDQWALQLRDGQPVVVPSPGLVAPLSSNPFYALSPEFTDIVKPPSPMLGESLPCEYVAVGTELALEVQPMDNPLTSTWEEEAMWVEPLAISAPMEEDVAGQQPDSAPKSSQTHPGMPSVWVSTMMKEVGECLGASYEGFEDKVMDLLCTIKASSALKSYGEIWQKSKSGPKAHVHRELKNLISSVNYEGGNSKRNTSTRGRALSLSK